MNIVNKLQIDIRNWIDKGLDYDFETMKTLSEINYFSDEDFEKSDIGHPYFGHRDVPLSAEYWNLDCLKRFEEIKSEPEKWELLKKCGWVDEYNNPTPIDYKFNSLGFRDDDFVEGDEDTIICLGDSFTNGIGMHRNLIWPTLLQEKLGKRVYNMGRDGGVDGAYVFRMLLYWWKKLRSKTVLIQFSPLWCREVLDKDGLYLVGNWTKEDERYKDIITSPIEIYLTHLRSMYAIQAFCDENKIDLHFIGFDKMNEIGQPIFARLMDGNIEPWHFARDLMHPGAPMHRGILETFLEKLNGQT